jgi:hypothetical protein
MWFLFGAICWTVWLNRNDYVFNNILISSPCTIIFRLISFLQHWMVAVRVEDKASLERLVDAIKSQVPEELMMTGIR